VEAKRRNEKFRVVEEEDGALGLDIFSSISKFSS